MSHWVLLGIAPTQDKGAIRRAYAQRLKGLRLEDEAAAFEKLREARECALREAEAPEITPRIFYVEADAAEPNEFLTTAQPAIDEPRERVVATDLLDDEAAPRPLLDGGRIGTDTLADLEARLTACLAPLAQPKAPVDMVALDAILGQIADLPAGARRDAERFCLQQMAARLKRPDGSFGPARALRLAPILLACDLTLGWSFSDAIIRDSLEARDAETISLMLAAHADEPSATKRPPVARLRRFDAQVLLADSPQRFSLYKAVAVGGTLPWRFEPWCAPAPHLWAFQRRCWLSGFAWYLAACGVSAIAVLPHAPPRGLVMATVIVTLTLCFVGGLLADRMVFFEAWRSARKADRRGLFDPFARRAFLRKQHARVHAGALLYLSIFFFWISMFPYFGLLRLFDIMPSF